MLKHFCFSYREMQDERNKLLSSGIKAVAYDGMPHSGSVSNPTEQAGIRLAEIDNNISIIENTAAEVGGNLFSYLLRGVTDHYATYKYLRYTLHMPCGKNMYYSIRRRFYYELSQKRFMIS